MNRIVSEAGIADRHPGSLHVTAEKQALIKHGITAVGPAVAMKSGPLSRGPGRCRASADADRAPELRREEGDGGRGPGKGEEEEQNEDSSHSHHAPTAQRVPGPVI